MQYWVLENGERVGPFTEAEVLQKASPETLVSYGAERRRFDQHPILADKTTGDEIEAKSQTASRPPREHDLDEEGDGNSDKKYWIFEDGERIGPLTEDRVRDWAKPETLVSDGVNWLKNGEHPHFRATGGMKQPSARAPREGASRKKVPGWA